MSEKSSSYSQNDHEKVQNVLGALIRQNVQKLAAFPQEFKAHFQLCRVQKFKVVHPVIQVFFCWQAKNGLSFGCSS